MTGCRIGKVTPKDKKIAAIKTKPRTYCHKAAALLGQQINDQTQAVGFFILEKDGNVKSGFSYDTGTALGEMIGSCDLLKSDISDYWNNEPYYSYDPDDCA